MNRLRPVLVGIVLAAGLSACSKGDGDEEASGFFPPTSESRADFASTLPKRFARLDRNHDGQIEMNEIPPKRAARMKKAGFDQDGDGKISLAEFTRGSLARFDSEDANHDGVVTGDERRAARKAWQAAADNASE